MKMKPLRLLPGGDPDSGWEPSKLTSLEAFTTGDHSEMISHVYRSGDNSILTGVWECAPCREEIDAYPVNEMMHVLEGSVTVTDADGNAETYEAGHTFFIPKGAPCTWEITKTLRKFYMIAA